MIFPLTYLQLRVSPTNTTLISIIFKYFEVVIAKFGKDDFARSNKLVEKKLDLKKEKNMLEVFQ